MSFLAYAFDRALWIAPPLFVLSAAVLAACIRDVTATVKRARLLSVPLAVTQEIELTEKGRVVLCGEGPLLSTRFSGLTYALTLEGRPVESRPSLFHARTSTLSTTRMELRYYELPVRGRYVLSVKGLPPDAGIDAEHRLVFMRPHLAHAMLAVVGILVASVGLIATLVLFLLRFTSPPA
jgi:hypothetical protein